MYSLSLSLSLRTAGVTAHAWERHSRGSALEELLELGEAFLRLLVVAEQVATYGCTYSTDVCMYVVTDEARRACWSWRNR